jgi:hypothetical protein
MDQALNIPDKFIEGRLYQIELANGTNMIAKSEGGFFWLPSWCRIHERMEWLKAIEPFNCEEIITILEVPDSVEEYAEFFIEKNRPKKAGI